MFDENSIVIQRNLNWEEKRIGSASSYGRKIGIRNSHQLQDYYQNIIRLIQGAKKILIFGPGVAKGGLEKEIKKSKALALKVSAVETTDKMTEKQIMARVRGVFVPYS